MTKLISNAEFAEIRAVINDVVDTFMEFDITFLRHGRTFDAWGEENPSPTVSSYVLKCLIEYAQDDTGKETMRTPKGAKDIQEMEVSFGVDYLETFGLMSTITEEPVFDRAKDYFIYEGNTYRLTAMVMDGPIKDKMALAVCTLRKEEKTA